MSRFLMVCTGNICRSPTAEAVMRHMAVVGEYAHIQVDSAGIHAYHVGESPDPRTIIAAEARGYHMHQLIARQVIATDYTEFDYLLAMDRSHERWLHAHRPEGGSAQIALFMPNAEIADPYYGGANGFERVLDEIEQGVGHWLSVART